MKVIFVVSQPDDWPLEFEGAEVIPAQRYLTDPIYRNYPDLKVFNLCKSCAYQSRGYYVSMLAEARGHHPCPDVKALEDLHADRILALLGPGIEKLIQAEWMPEENILEMDCYFGRTADVRHQKIGEQIFRLLRVPLLHIRFERDDQGWHLRYLQSMTPDQIAAPMLPLLKEAAKACIAAHDRHHPSRNRRRPALAILHSSDCQVLPSNPQAIRKFQEAAEMLGMRPEVITHDDIGRIAAFDGLFIRDTTNVNHYTYQLARQAALAGLVVMDDPDSILRCSNKVFLAELLEKHHISMPRTLLLQQSNLDQAIPTLGLPCVLKRPDGAFSLGVEKVTSEAELKRKADRMFQASDLIVAQEYLPTAFDWRIGVLDRKPLFACKYFMAPGHWQVIKHDGSQYRCEGRTRAVALDAVPENVIATALQAANLIGDGFYGVDLKQRGQQVYVIEINDNPNVDAGNEDGILKDALYHAVMDVFRKRIEARREGIA